MTDIRPAVYCEQCGRFALAQLNGYYLCALCIMAFFDNLDDMKEAQVDMRPLRPSDSPVAITAGNGESITETLR